MNLEGQYRTLPRRLLSGIIVTIGFLSTPVQAECSTEGISAVPGAQPTPAIDPNASLRSRVSAPNELVLQSYREAGASDVKQHLLNETEWAAVDLAIEALPPLHQQILRHHLRHLSFVDASYGTGSALTSPVETCGGPAQFDITLRASLFDDTMTDFLNRKEMFLFEADSSGYTVHIEAGDTTVLTYALLHEATHVVDRTLGFTEQSPNAFRDGIWDDSKRALAAPYGSNPVSRILWRGGSKVPLGQAPALYRGLSETPFVSLYAAATASEDFAETVAWQQLSMRFGVELRIEVSAGNGQPVYSLEPLKSPRVRARFAAVEAFLASKKTPASQSPYRSPKPRTVWSEVVRSLKAQASLPRFAVRWILRSLDASATAVFAEEFRSLKPSLQAARVPELR